MKKCPTCKGEGTVKCPRCNGAGSTRGLIGLNKCGHCPGSSGKVKCPNCEGQGKIKD